MKQKTLLSIIVFVSIILVCTFSYAAEAMNSVKDSLGTMGNAAGNIIGTTAGSIKNGVNSLANGAKNVAEDITRTDSNNFNNYENDSMLNMQESNYSAIRTATSANTNNLLGLSSNAWLWIIMGVVGAIIVALVWYYGSQFENQSYDHNK